MSDTLVVAGLGMVAHRLVAELREHDHDDRWRVVAIGEETHHAYDRVGLSSYLDGRSAADLGLATAELLADPAVEFRTKCRVTALDRDAQRVRLDDGSDVDYDALVLATGSRPFVPPVPGHDLTGCHVYRTLDDLDALRAAASPGRDGVVVGGGLLGLEAANALRLLGMTPHVLEMAPHLMAVQLDAAGGALLAERVEGLGVRVHCGTAAASVDGDPEGRVRSVTLDDGTVIDTDLVVFCSGIRPRDDLAAPAGLARGERGGFLVDDRCRTDDPRVWAVGECAAVAGRTYGLVAPGLVMAGVVARRLLGEDAVFSPPEESTTLKLVGVDVASFGDAHAAGDGALEVAYRDATAGTYAKLVLDAGGEVLLGGVLAGDTAAFPALRAALGRRLPASPESLLRR